jgi:hypothetical protein
LVRDARGRTFFRKKLNLELRGSKMRTMRVGMPWPAVMIATVALSKLTVPASVAAPRAARAPVAAIASVPSVGSVAAAFVADSSLVTASA